MFQIGSITPGMTSVLFKVSHTKIDKLAMPLLIYVCIHFICRPHTISNTISAGTIRYAGVYMNSFTRQRCKLWVTIESYGFVYTFNNYLNLQELVIRITVLADTFVFTVKNTYYAKWRLYQASLYTPLITTFTDDCCTRLCCMYSVKNQ